MQCATFAAAASEARLHGAVASGGRYGVVLDASLG